MIDTFKFTSKNVGNSEEVLYIYSADGAKLAAINGSSLTLYCGPIVYNGTTSGSQTTVTAVDHIVHPEGMIRLASNQWVYYYTLRDHIGSTRALCHGMGNQLVADAITDYYPFGTAHQYSDLNLNRYLFSGKELQDQTIGGKMLEMYDFGSRFYDPILGRWFGVDPQLQLVSPYGYCANNPVRSYLLTFCLVYFNFLLLLAVLKRSANHIKHLFSETLECFRRKAVLKLTAPCTNSKTRL